MIKASVKVNVAGFGQVAVPIKNRDVTLKGVKAGAKIVSKAAKARAPRKSGALKIAIGWKAKKGSRGATQSFAVIGARSRVKKLVSRPGRRSSKPILAIPALYLHLVEGGVQPHAIGMGSRIARKAGQQSVKLGKLHPGFPGKPFLQPAFEISRAAAAAATKAAMGAEIQAQIAKGAAAITATLR